MPLRKVSEWTDRIARQVAAGELWADGVVPSVALLARQLRLSTTSSNRVLKALAAKGILFKDDARNRYFCSGAKLTGEGAPRRAGIRVPASEDVAARLREDIVTGSCARDGEMPAARELRLRYACSFHTLGAALHELEREGLVRQEPGGRGYRLRRGDEGGRGGSHLWLSGHGHYPVTDPFLAQLGGGAERSAMALGWGRLRQYFVYPRPHRAPPPANHLVSGFIHIDYRHEHASFYPPADKPNIPQVLVDRSSSSDEQGEECAFFVKIRPDHGLSGSLAARHLIALGHRRVAFYAHIGRGDPWLTVRLEQMRRLFGEVGGAESVRVYDSPAPLSASWRDPRVGARMREPLHDPGVRNELKRLLPPPLVHRHIVVTSWAMQAALETAVRMEPVFEQALCDRRVTAWVCVNDELAAIARQFLERRGVRVPERVSLMGFDNHPMSPLIDLTTVDLRYDRIGGTAVRCLAFPRSVSKFHDRTLLSPGTLIVRGSTARARR